MWEWVQLCNFKGRAMQQPALGFAWRMKNVVFKQLSSCDDNHVISLHAPWKQGIHLR
jgi:hypothetical protein